MSCAVDYTLHNYLINKAVITALRQDYFLKEILFKDLLQALFF